MVAAFVAHGDRRPGRTSHGGPTLESPRKGGPRSLSGGTLLGRTSRSGPCPGFPGRQGRGIALARGLSPLGERNGNTGSWDAPLLAIGPNDGFPGSGQPGDICPGPCKGHQGDASADPQKDPLGGPGGGGRDRDPLVGRAGRPGNGNGFPFEPGPRDPLQKSTPARWPVHGKGGQSAPVMGGLPEDAPPNQIGFPKGPYICRNTSGSFPALYPGGPF